ncbi:hypothetical protein ABBQ32_005551 [Trebouxia sp. C0010 RCD-2024]
MQALQTWAETLADQGQSSRAPLDLLLNTCQSKQTGPLRPVDSLSTPRGQTAAFEQGLSKAWSGSKHKDLCGSAEAEVQAVLPLCTYLIRSEGKGAVDIIPRLVQCLRRLPGCSASSKYPLRWQTALSALFNSLYKVMCLEHFPEAGRQDISQAVQQLLILAVEGPAPTSSVAETDADMLAGLRGAVCLSHDASAFLPVLPEHAAELLSRLLHKHMAPSKELLLDNSHQLVVLLLAAQLCKGPAKGRGLDPGLAHQMAAVACSWLRDMMRPVTASIDGAETSSAEEGVSGPTPLPSRQLVAAAAFLASTLSAQAARSQQVHMALGEASGEEGHLSAVVELMLDITESSVAFCWELGAGEAAADQVMGLASAALKEGQAAFAACVTAQPAMLSDIVSRLRSSLLSSARLSEGELLRCTDDLGPTTAQTAPHRVWRWNLTADAMPLGTGPGAHAQQLCRAVSEAACATLAAAWRSGDQAGVKAAFLPLSDVGGFSTLATTGTERQAVLLSVGRLCCMTDAGSSHRHSAASEELTRMAVTLLLDTLGSDDASGLSQVDACAVYTLACLGVTYGMQDRRWAYEQVADALCKLYKGVQGRVGQHLLHGSPRAGCPGALADALLALAQGLKAAHTDIRQDLQMRLLGLFVDFALNPLEGKQVWDLGALLPAIAALSQDLPAHQAVGKKKIHSNSFDILQVSQEDDANRIKMFRLLWLYAALYDLTGIGARGPKYPFPEAWRLGLGQIALASPFAVVGGGSETTEKLEAEFGERLLRLGPKAAAQTLAALLTETVSGSTSLTHPSSAARAAHVLIIAALNLVRVEVAPLPRPQDLPPVALLLAQQQVLGAASTDGPWLQAITERVMTVYCERLCGYAWSSQVDDVSRTTPCIDNLAKVLVENLTGRSGNPDLASLADRLLHSMLARFPQLLWSAPVIQALLLELQREEGALYLTGAKPRLTLARVLRIRKKKKQVPLPAWTWLIKVVQEGAALAPAWTEALFHELLDQETSPASGAALRHAANIMSLYDSAKTRHCMAGMQHSISGVQALNRKARYRGIVAGFQSLGEAQAPPSAVGALTQIAASLQEAIASHAPAKTLQNRYLQATAALIQSSSSNSMQLKLLHLIAWLPAHRFGTFSMSLAVFAWHWICAESPQLQEALIAEIVQAWLYTADNRMGIFDCDFDAKLFMEGTVTDVEEATHGDDNVSSESPAPYGDAVVPISPVDAISAHHIWVGFFLQTWQVMSYGASAESAATTALFTRMLQHSLKDSNGLSQHPAATGRALSHCLTKALCILDKARACTRRSTLYCSSCLLQPLGRFFKSLGLVPQASGPQSCEHLAQGFSPLCVLALK